MASRFSSGCPRCPESQFAIFGFDFPNEQSGVPNPRRAATSVDCEEPAGGVMYKSCHTSRGLWEKTLPADPGRMGSDPQISPPPPNKEIGPLLKFGRQPRTVAHVTLNRE